MPTTSPSTFREVVALALSDSDYAEQLRKLSLKAMSGDESARLTLAGTFKLSAEDLATFATTVPAEVVKELNNDFWKCTNPRTSNTTLAATFFTHFLPPHHPRSE